MKTLKYRMDLMRKYGLALSLDELFWPYADEGRQYRSFEKPEPLVGRHVKGTGERVCPIKAAIDNRLIEAEIRRIEAGVACG